MCHLAIALAASGCREAPPPPDFVSDVAERGPIKLTVRATPKALWIGDPLTIDLRVVAPEEYVVQLPGAGDFGDAFEVRRMETQEARPDPAGGLLWRATITVEPLQSGAVEVPPLVARYAHRPATPDEKPTFDAELATASLKLEVRSALTTQDSVMSPRDITGTLAPQPAPRSPWFWAGLASGVIAAALAAYLLARWLKRRASRPAPPIAAEVWARNALDKLAAEGLFDRGHVREFYYRLSEIVRVYIERKFSLAAPEMTTEEFLNALARSRGVLPYPAERLREFLEACDLVKYAAFQPRREGADHAFASACAFVDETARAAGTHAAPSAARAEEMAA